MGNSAAADVVVGQLVVRSARPVDAGWLWAASPRLADAATGRELYLLVAAEHPPLPAAGVPGGAASGAHRERFDEGW